MLTETLLLKRLVKALEGIEKELKIGNE